MYAPMPLRWLFATLLLTSLPLRAEDPAPPPISLDIIDSGPWDNSYSALEAPRTKTWIRFRSPSMADLQDGDRLRYWVQWAPALDGPWRVHSKGEIELRHPGATPKKEEHPRLKTRGYVTKAPHDDDVASIEMNPLSPSKWSAQALPYFRLAEAMRRPGAKWVKEPRRMLAPEDNNATYSQPLEAKLDVVYVYLPDTKSRQQQSVPFTHTEVRAGQPGPWSSPSFKQGELSYVSFFIALGGTNCGCVVPSHFFSTTGPAGELEFWSCRNKPNGYRGAPVDDSSIDAVWWGIAPVRVPMPPPGESATLEVSTPLFGEDYNKTYTIYGLPATPLRLAERRINKVRYSNLLERVNPNTPAPDRSAEDIATAKNSALATFRKQLELYRERGEEEAAALADAYIVFLELQQEEYLLRRSQVPATPQERAGEALRDILAAAGIAKELQMWPEMKQQLEVYLRTLSSAISAGVLNEDDRSHYLYSQFGLRSLQPFEQEVTRGSYMELIKEWAWTVSDPKAYAEALAIKQSLSTAVPSPARSTDDYITPQEYRELAELIMERTGNRDQAEDYWRKADQLLLDPDSPFYNRKADEGKLHMQRPGWWPE